MTEGRWPRLIGFSWWNAEFRNDPETGRESNMRVQDSPSLATVMRQHITSRVVVGNRLR